MGRTLHVMIDSGHHHALIDDALTLTARLVAEHEQQIYEKASAKSAWGIPGPVDRHIAEVVIMAIYDTILAALWDEAKRRVADDATAADSRLKQTLTRSLQDIAETVRTDKTLAAADQSAP
ncbi:MAG: hypothetical protein FD153_1050 [Rhodospirillaceae bacterium]|nr:MAG: hypothetical protein FD153_1050 [Rhodospirillaceae bacterium]